MWLKPPIDKGSIIFIFFRFGSETTLSSLDSVVFSMIGTFKAPCTLEAPFEALDF